MRRSIVLLVVQQLRRLRMLVLAALLARMGGQGLVEYGLILTFIAMVVVGIMTVLGQTVSGLWYQRIIDAVNNIVP